MFVPCPHCGFLVALIVSRPDAAQRCPRCGQPLQLTDDVADDSATASASAAIDASDATVESIGDPGASGRDVGNTADISPGTGPGAEPPLNAGIEAEDEAASAATDTSHAGDTATDLADATAAVSPAAAPAPRTRSRRAARPQRATPSFARRSVSMFESSRRWPGVAAVVVLLAVLALQLLLAQRHALATDAGWRPTVAALCNTIGCRLQPWREPDAFTMLARDVRPADRAGVLQVQASFRNDARWPQPWPRLLLRLNDRHGRTVGERLFTPAEYLGQRASTPNLLAPGQSASVDFAVREPAAEIVAFDFDFR